jgi:hypothetical protein
MFAPSDLGTVSVRPILPAVNTVAEGGANPSTLLLPVYR